MGTRKCALTSFGMLLSRLSASENSPDSG